MKNRIDALTHVGRVSLDVVAKVVNYRDVVPGNDFIISEHMSGSDYSGSTVTRSNFDVFKEQFGKCEGVVFLYGDYGSYGIAISLDCLMENEEILEILEALEDYPCIDDDALCAYEMELIEEAWEDWAMDRYRKDLEMSHTNIDLIDDFDIREIFEAVALRLNEYWEADENVTYIDVRRIAFNTTSKDLKP